MTNTPNKISLNIKFSELTCSISKGKEKKRILKGVSGTFSSGKISAILGPSGAGKTTLMNILAGLKNNIVSGDVLVNEKPRCLKSFRKQSCYIMQEEDLLPFLTMQESMEIAAKLKLGNNHSNFSKNMIIKESLSSLGLEESKKTRVSNLSGGEKKRLLIAFELINNPSVMFLDEPTSGLDSYNSYQSIVLLKKLATGGRNIICSIHQPSARLFEKFDYVYALAEGRCIYRGTVPGLLPFISSISLECPSYNNPADFLIEAASGAYGNYVMKMVDTVNSTLAIDGARNDQNEMQPQLDLISGSSEHECMIQNEAEIDTPLNKNSYIDVSSCNQNVSQRKETNVHCSIPFCTQFYILLFRTLKIVLRDPMLTMIRLVFHLACAIFIGMLYYNIGNEASEMINNVGLLVLSIVFFMFSAGLPTLITFPMETKVLLRELFNNWYSLKAYYLAKTLVDFPFQIAFSLIYITIIYFMTNQPLEIQRFVTMSAIGAINSLISQSIGLAIGAGTDIQHAVYIAPFSLIPPLVFSGFIIISSEIPVYFRWMTYLSYMRYCFEGSLKTTYGYGRSELHCSEEFCYFKYPEKILELYAIKEYPIWIDLLILLIFFFLLRVLGFLILRWRVRKELGI